MAKLLVLVIALLAQQSLAFFQNDIEAPEVSPEGICAEIKVTLLPQITLKVGEHTQPNNGTLYRLCGSSQLIDLSKPVNFVHLFADYNNHNYNNNPNFGDKFIARRDDDPKKTIQLMIAPQLGKWTMDDVKKYEMIPALMTTRSELKSYTNVKAEVIYETRTWSGETIHLSPGWSVKLPIDFMLEQTLIPGPNSTLKEQKVTVMAGWYNVTKTEGLHAYVDRSVRTNGHIMTDPSREFVTIFFKKPHLNDPLINPRHTNATIVAEIGEKNHFSRTKVQFFPGWKGELKTVSVQFMIPEPDSGLAAKTVVVYPKYYIFKGDEGMHCEVDLLYANQTVSVYFDPNTIKEVGDEPIKGPDGILYLDAQTVPQYNQSLYAERIKLSPGWTGILDKTIQQTVIPEPGSVLEKQVVTIIPGWASLYKAYEGISVFLQSEHADQYVSMYFSKPPNPNKH